MKRRLILHIGAHRTATSALQDYLFQNLRALKTRGFFYPFKVRRHMELMNDLFSGARKPGDIARLLTTRANALRHDIHTIILSDEDICLRQDLSPLAPLRDSFDVKVVYTLRRQDIWLESWFFQNIKWQWNDRLSHCTLDEFLAMRDDFHWIHYDRYVRHLEKTFGRRNIILNIHEKQQMPDGPIELFCDSIGLTDRDGLAAPTHMNASFSPVISEFMRCLPLDCATEQYRHVLTTACASIDRALCGKGQRKSERLIPHPDRVALMDEYQAGNRALARRYFNRDTLFLEPLPEPDAPLADMTLPASSYELMEHFVGPLVNAVIEHQKKTGARQPGHDG